MGEPQDAQILEAVQQMQQMQQMNRQSPQAEAKDPPARTPPPTLPQPQEHKSVSGLLQFLRLDSDALLILPLILLLLREGADDKLVLALLYVLL